MNLSILAVDYGPDLLNDIANQYIKAINNGFGLIRGDVTHLLNVLIILSIIWSAAMWAVSEDQVIIQFARKVIYIGFFAWIIQNWQGLTDKLARSRAAHWPAPAIRRGRCVASPAPSDRRCR